MIERKTILIIEDETALLYALEAELSYAGFQIMTATEGKDGLEKIKRFKPDLVVLDIMLPDIDGLEILKQIKEDPQMKSIPVIIVSNLEKKETVEKGLKLGAKEYIIKTQYTLEEVLKKIKETLAKIYDANI